MDLALSPQDEAFRDEVRSFLDDNLSDDLREAGRKTGGVFADIAAGLRWHKVLAGRGWSAPTWPREFGGTGWSATQRYLFSRECAAVDAPRIFSMGIRMVGPVIMKYGTPEQQARYLPAIVSGDIVFCQGYSEPGSGSDLASLKTRAVRDGEAYTPKLYARIEDIRRIAAEEAADGAGRLVEERGFAQRLAEAEMEVQALEMIEMQVLSDLSRGKNPGAVSSAMKIRGSETLQKLDHLGVEALAWYAAPFEPQARMLGHNEPTVSPEWGITAMPLYLNNRASTIYAGSNEIQRNIIAKAVLGL